MAQTAEPEKTSHRWPVATDRSPGVRLNDMTPETERALHIAELHTVYVAGSPRTSGLGAGHDPPHPGKRCLRRGRGGATWKASPSTLMISRCRSNTTSPPPTSPRLSQPHQVRGDPVELHHPGGRPALRDIDAVAISFGLRNISKIQQRSLKSPKMVVSGISVGSCGWRAGPGRAGAWAGGGTVAGGRTPCAGHGHVGPESVGSQPTP